MAEDPFDRAAHNATRTATPGGGEQAGPGPKELFLHRSRRPLTLSCTKDFIPDDNTT